uniref:Uncharacterized protein n=1 Tax=Anguilla anguilla TaxID=7936 RepID=A0A0E9WIH3_ANGAN
MSAVERFTRTQPYHGISHVVCCEHREHCDWQDPRSELL